MQQFEYLGYRITIESVKSPYGSFLFRINDGLGDGYLEIGYATTYNDCYHAATTAAERRIYG
jgi:hypothetical protein